MIKSVHFHLFKLNNFAYILLIYFFYHLSLLKYLLYLCCRLLKCFLFSIFVGCGCQSWQFVYANRSYDFSLGMDFSGCNSSCITFASYSWNCQCANGTFALWCYLCPADKIWSSYSKFWFLFLLLHQKWQILVGKRGLNEKI